MNQNLTNLPSIPVPKWLSILYSLITFALVPWTINLSLSLPYRHLSSHWDIAWVGFDLMLIVAMALTAYFALSKSGWVVLSATSAATLLFADAWLDVWTSRPGRQMAAAIVIAFLVELPLAAASLWLSLHAGRVLITKKGR